MSRTYSERFEGGYSGTAESIEKIIEKLEEDEDVQNVFHNMKEDDSEEE